MALWIYIDETGSMLTGTSGVGGLATFQRPDDLRRTAQNVIKKFNQNHQTALKAEEDLHAQEILAAAKPKHKAIPLNVREAFVEEIISTALDCSLFRFAALTDEYFFSTEGTYQVILRAALEAAFRHLGATASSVDFVNIVIATRRHWERVQEPHERKRYTDELSRRLTQRLERVLTRDLPDWKSKLSGVGFKVDFESARTNTGLAFADFTLWRLNQQDIGRDWRKAKSEGFIVHEGDFVFDEEQHDVFLKQHARDMIRANRLAVSIQLANQYEDPGSRADLLQESFAALRLIADPEVIDREARSVLHEARLLVHCRNRMPDALEKANRTLNDLAAVGEAAINAADGPAVRQAWAPILIAIYDEWLDSLNHAGDVEKQTVIRDKQKNLFERFKDQLPITAAERNGLRLRLLLRTCVTEFNRYEFSQTAALLGPHLEFYASIAPPPDELLGELLGAMGQALAFQARSEPSYRPQAIEHFKRSLQACTRLEYQAMARNFLATLYWEAHEPQAGLRWMEQHPGLGADLKTPDLMLAAIKRCGERQSLFDLANLLRIWATLARMGRMSVLPALLQDLSNRARNWPSTHPRELIFKWLAYLLLLLPPNDEHVGLPALLLVQEGCQECERGGFTLQTMSIPFLFLEDAIFHRFKGRIPDSRRDALDIAARRLREFATLEPAFSSFADAAGLLDPDSLVRLAGDRSNEALYEAITVLPFYYS